MTKGKMTIEELEQELERGLTFPGAFQPLIPPGYRPRVALHGEERRKKRTASAESWSPETGEIHIRFEPSAASTTSPVANPPALSIIEKEKPAKLSREVERFPREAAADDRQAGAGPLEKPATADPLADLIRALDRAESRPGYNFVALKWFRDSALLEEGFPWVRSDSARRGVLRDAIDKRLILTNRVENPKSPQFPVTSIRLNRLLPEVQAILGKSGPHAEDFHPVEIRGESLSTTILRERR